MNTSFEYIVESAWLAEHLDDPNVVVLDTTTHLIPREDKPYDIVSGRSDFEAAHIPGAQFVDLDKELSDPNQPAHLRFMLPSMQVFAQVMGRLGITNQTHVVCYATANHWWATRMWWMLRVFGHDKASVLNGGFQKWSREGRAIAVGQSKPRVASSFEPAFRAELVANKADVFAAINDQRICTINALRPEQHRGEPGGSNYGRPGHIAGSVNIAAIHIVDENNVFKPLHELRIMFSKALASDRVITYCGGGIAASSDALILTMLGHQDVRIYDASLSEWARDESLPMETA